MAELLMFFRGQTNTMCTLDVGLEYPREYYESKNTSHVWNLVFGVFIKLQMSY